MATKHTHTHATPIPPDPQNRDRYNAMKRVTLVGAFVNILLSVVKIVFGYLGQSQSLVADGIHSVSDLVTDAMVIVAAKHSSRHADTQHPYGHGRFETVITVALGSFLIVVAGGIAIDAIRRLLEPDLLLHPAPITLAFAAMSIVAKEVLYHYTVRVGTKIRSNMLIANAWHHRTDAISSVIVFVGIAGTLYGLEYLDALAAIGVSILIAKIGWDLSAQSLRELVDTALEPEQVEEIKQVIQAVPGVKELHMLRTRKMGSDALVDVHIQVEPRLSVSEGHFISESVRTQLINLIEDVNDVMVHIDPEDDETNPTCIGLYNREVVINALQDKWQQLELTKYIQRITLHYLDGKIHVELLLPLEKAHLNESKHFSEQLQQIAEEITDIADIRVFYE